jgi:hypothetical protein
MAAMTPQAFARMGHGAYVCPQARALVKLQSAVAAMEMIVKICLDALKRSWERVTVNEGGQAIVGGFSCGWCGADVANSAPEPAPALTLQTAIDLGQYACVALWPAIFVSLSFYAIFSAWTYFRRRLPAAF